MLIHVARPVTDCISWRGNSIARNEMIKNCTLLIVVALVTSRVPSAQAKVIDLTANGFTIKHSVEVNKSPAEAYAVFVGKIASWWDADHTCSGKSENLSIELRP